VSCTYDFEEGTTRLQDLRTRLDSARIELARMQRFIHSLQFSSDADAAWLLVQLRLGYGIAQVAGIEAPRSNEYVCFKRVYQPAI
jgi:hypothetical protein